MNTLTTRLTYITIDLRYTIGPYSSFQSLAMFSRFYLVCIYCVIICDAQSPSAPIQNTDRLSSSQVNNYDVRIAQQDTKFAEFAKYISGLETKIEQQNVRFADQNTNIANLKTLISEQNVQLCELKSQIGTLRKPERNVTSTHLAGNGVDTGVLFTRWGRLDCPHSISTPIYNGTTGGAYSSHTGGAVNYVCMPGDPLWNHNKYFNGGSFSYMYGVEYKTVTHTGFSQYEVPCAVCRATPYTTTMMIPGRNKCYPGWQEAYSGELVSGFYGHKAASEFACLDHKAHKIGSSTDSIIKSFNSVKASCENLPCPPYEQGALLTCVVCLK